MPIWIRTQNNRLKECIEISQPVRFDLRDGKVEYKIFGFGNFEDNGTTLGTYQTEEKALKIIGEIWERITSFGTDKYYTMPKE